ncbi:hypothetical protein CEXT_522361 [Caerostris extrusa]|uniref:Uncharacterized protein n=1 Tax=Caerostris extrusa TaxID=172846 RepID=A0AAV4Q606_CAEEX|nr:hypothetical protein CEXT_522361 [Caerostris extrusa]
MTIGIMIVGYHVHGQAHVITNPKLLSGGFNSRLSLRSFSIIAACGSTSTFCTITQLNNIILHHAGRLNSYSGDTCSPSCFQKFNADCDNIKPSLKFESIKSSRFAGERFDNEFRKVLQVGSN